MNIFTILKTKSSKDLVERFVANNKNGKITEQEFNNMEEQLKQAKLSSAIKLTVCKEVLKKPL